MSNRIKGETVTAGCSDDAREIIQEMLEGIREAAPNFSEDLRSRVVERLHKTASTDTPAGRRKLPGCGDYARAFTAALEDCDLHFAATWYNGLSWDETVCCDEQSVGFFLGSLTDAADDSGYVDVKFANERIREGETGSLYRAHRASR